MFTQKQKGLNDILSVFIKAKDELVEFVDNSKIKLHDLKQEELKINTDLTKATKTLDSITNILD
jgi:ABC-type transporter Mla subunit MlaD